MFTRLKFFKKPTDPEQYLTYLKSIQSQASSVLEDKCTTLETSGFKRLLFQKQKIDREVMRVNQIVTYLKYQQESIS